ncbi:hypothetical protein ASPZODRAFT_129748 [Penicilliopsis zonata CBS 506.65]|uniref:Flavin reductase like domain-containing protein n=1 Tax=Penicilliopsis zonata CBS 506.65 TaxID=1073090 RepID=A0A1L9SQ18_9EURO|nr:hypothetical protein ASPZODRAFT_129748 [Penicilliopsis zonata CBS 506.65]OJJ49310.1 hypothetical protein ASPZODRAFT_129748 [Penicilliopsis zonata CBS 506.65]
MRHVPHPVAIITSTDPRNGSDSPARGMTVSSFNTVSLSPSPIISFNVRRPSETLAALLLSDRFLVHLLAPNLRTAALARAFSRGNNTRTELEDFEFTQYLSEEGKVPLSLPLLREKEEHAKGSDIPFVLECKVHQQVQVNDHTVVLGQVLHTLGQIAESRRSEADELCLTYADTRFWRMGDQID